MDTSRRIARHSHLRRRWVIAVLAGLLACLTIAPAADAPAAGYDLYLLVGQSNMAGRGKVDAESTQVHPRVFALNREGQWVPATDPLHFDKPGAGVGPGLAFGKALAEAAPTAQIGLIPCAVGGTSIKVWEPGKQDPATKAFPYDDMLKRVQLARKSGTFKGIIWHQGESDRNVKDEANQQYAAQLTALIARLRKDLDAPDLPVVIGELPQFEPAKQEATTKFNATVQELATKVPHVACITAKDLKDRGDKLHFDAASARTLGQRYAAAMLALQTPAAAPPAKP